MFVPSLSWKMIIYIYKWLKTTVFAPDRSSPGPLAGSASAAPARPNVSAAHKSRPCLFRKYAHAVSARMQGFSSHHANFDALG